MLWPKLPRTLKGLAYQVRLVIGKRLRDTRHVLQLTDPDKLHDGTLPPGISVSFFTRVQEVPESLIVEVEETLGATDFRSELVRQFEANARLCVVFAEGRVGSIGWLKFGRDIPVWLIPLDDDDAVLSRDVTAPALRGRRLHAINIAARSRAAVGAKRLFCDCHVHNPASLHSYERSGWSVVATVTLR